MRSTQAEAFPSACCCLATCTGVHKRRTGRESVRIFTAYNTCARILAAKVRQGMPGIDTQQMASILFLVHCQHRSQINSTTGVVMSVCRWWRLESMMCWQPRQGRGDLPVKRTVMFPHMNCKPVMPLHSGGRVPVSLLLKSRLQRSRLVSRRQWVSQDLHLRLCIHTCSRLLP